MTLVCPGLIDSGMFTGVKMRMGFLLPPLTPSQVSDVILDNLIQRTSKNVTLPSLIWPIAILARVLPLQIADFCREVKLFSYVYIYIFYP